MIAREELTRQKRKVALFTKLKTLSALAGEWDSPFTGEGTDFSEIRQYLPGDDIRRIDWNTTARTGELHIRSFLAERDLVVMLLLDLSRSMAFGSGAAPKLEVEALVAGLLALSTVAKNNKVGFISFTDRVEQYLRPRRGKPQFWRIVDAILAEPQGCGTDLTVALELLDNVVQRSLTFLISDFLPPANGFRTLRSIKERHDIVPIIVEDPRETLLPAGSGLVCFGDMESGQEILVDLGAAGETFGRLMREQRERRDQALAGLGLDCVTFTTGEQMFFGKLDSLFRRKRMRRGGVRRR